MKALKTIKAVIAWVLSGFLAMLYLPLLVAMCGRAERMSNDRSTFGKAVNMLIKLFVLLLSMVPLLTCGAAAYALWSAVMR